MLTGLLVTGLLIVTLQRGLYGVLQDWHRRPHRGLSSGGRSSRGWTGGPGVRTYVERAVLLISCWRPLKTVPWPNITIHYLLHPQRTVYKPFLLVLLLRAGDWVFLALTAAGDSDLRIVILLATCPSLGVAREDDLENPQQQAGLWVTCRKVIIAPSLTRQRWRYTGRI